VKALNANWVAGPDGDDGQFEIMIVTEDDQRHIMAPQPRGDDRARRVGKDR